MYGAVRTWHRRLVGVIGLIALLGCEGYDSDFIPYGLIGFDVYVYHEPTDHEFFVRRVENLPGFEGAAAR
jgi:hypothetical protein